MLCNAFENSPIIQEYFCLEGDLLSPVKHLKLRKKQGISSWRTIDDEWNTLFDLADYVSYKFSF